MCVCVCVCAFVFICVCIYMCARLYLYVCVCVCAAPLGCVHVACFIHYACSAACWRVVMIYGGRLQHAGVSGGGEAVCACVCACVRACVCVSVHVRLTFHTWLVSKAISSDVCRPRRPTGRFLPSSEVPPAVCGAALSSTRATLLPPPSRLG